MHRIRRISAHFVRPISHSTLRSPLLITPRLTTATVSGSHPTGGADRKQIHTSAATGYTNAADTYERGRPDFPAAALEAITRLIVGRFDDAGNSNSSTSGGDTNQQTKTTTHPITILELGAGTGKFTRLLSKSVAKAVASPPGFKIIATEPVAAMRQQMLKALQKQAAESKAGSTAASTAAVAPGDVPSTGTVASITVEAGTAESVPFIPSGSVDAVIVAQAFHWFDGSAAQREIARVLKPNRQGKVILVWNRRDTHNSLLQNKLDEVMSRYEPEGTPRYKTGEWTKPWKFRDPQLKAAILKDGGRTDTAPYTTRLPPSAESFTGLDLAQFPHVQSGNEQMIHDRTLSVSFIAEKPPAVRDQIREEVIRDVIKPVLTRADSEDVIIKSESGGAAEFRLRYVTDVYFCARM